MSANPVTATFLSSFSRFLNTGPFSAAEVSQVFVSSLQAPLLPYPALKEAGQTAQACAARTTAGPVWGDFTVTLPASLHLVDPAEGGMPHS